MELTPWDWYLWEAFIESEPRWRIMFYRADRVGITNGKYEIDAVTMEVAITRAKDQLRWDRSRPRYYCSCY